MIRSRRETAVCEHRQADADGLRCLPGTCRRRPPASVEGRL